MEAFQLKGPEAPAVGRYARIGVVLPVLSLFMLAGHFLRLGNPGLCFSIAALSALAVTRRASVRIALMGALAAGLVVWAGAWRIP